MKDIIFSLIVALSILAVLLSPAACTWHQNNQAVELTKMGYPGPQIMCIQEIARSRPCAEWIQRDSR